jgi:hypothetical protein
MVAAECLYLANYKVGCRIVKLVYNNAVVSLERAFLVDSKDSANEAVLMKKKQIDDFMKNQSLAAKSLLVNGVIDLSSNFLFFSLSLSHSPSFFLSLPHSLLPSLCVSHLSAPKYTGREYG